MGSEYSYLTFEVVSARILGVCAFILFSPILIPILAFLYLASQFDAK